MMTEKINHGKASIIKKSLAKINTLERKLALFNEPIAIIGMGCRYPGGANSPEEFWNILISGVDGIREVPKERFDVDAYYCP